MKPLTHLFCLIQVVLLFSANLKAQIPKLNSYVPANATIYLDFDGQSITGTSWNWNGPINAEPAQLSPEVISEIFERISEDYRPFNLNITTDSSVYFEAPFNKRIRVIITPTSSWYGVAGGVSYVGSFNWGDETPAWIFSNLLGNNTKYIAEACSHEMGHTLGLQHQSTYDNNCYKVAEYNEGQGSGEIGWAPIMGLSYYKNLTTWHNGTNSIGCTSIQNDISVIAGPVNNFGFRDDDHGNTPSTATQIKMDGQDFMVSGLINGMQDVDAFALKLDYSTKVWLAGIPQNVGAGNAGADVDLKITLLNDRSDTIGVYNPSALLGVGLDTLLSKGTYYIVVGATDNINHSVYGSMGLFSLAGSVPGLLPYEHFLLNALRKKGRHLLKWDYEGKEKVKKMTVEVSSDGRSFRPLVVLNGNARSFEYKSFDVSSYYRINAVTSKDEKSYFSNISFVQRDDDAEESSVTLVSNLVRTSLRMVSPSNYQYEVITAGGQLISRGTLVKGMNEIDLQRAPRGILFMRISGNVVNQTEKIIKQ